MAKNRTIEVKGVNISVVERGKEDFISLSDIANGFEGGTGLIEKWIRNKNTIEFLAVWESLYNPNFNSTEFGGIRSEAGTNRFMMSAKQWIQRTQAIGIIASAGRYGGTYAHKDIAIEFCSWISPEFKLLLIREFQRLKEKEGFTYANEAEILNTALFGITSKEWKQQNPELALQGKNIRDYADLHHLTVLSNLESYNSILLSQNIPKEQRLIELRKTALSQLKTLQSMSHYSLDKLKSPHLKKLEKPDDNMS